MKVASMSAPARREIWLIIGMFRSTDPILFFIQTSQLCALFESETARPLEPTTLAIGNYFHNTDSRLVNRGHTPMVSPQVVPNLDPVNPSSPANQRINTTIPSESTDHFEGFYVESLKELPDTRLIRFHFLAALRSRRKINLDRWLEWATQSRRRIGKSLIRLKFRQRLYGTFRASPDFIHKCLKIRKIPSPTTTYKREHEKHARELGRPHFLPPSSL